MSGFAPTLVDTHAHVDDRQFEADRDEVIARAAAAGVTTIVNIGYRPGIWETTIALAARHEAIRHTLGVHPHHADLWSDDVEQHLRTLIAATRPVAIGEIGLDLFRNLTTLEDQLRAFRAQALMAVEVDLPMVIHLRAAEAELLPELRQLPPQARCVLHSFEGSQELATLAVDRGWFIGVGGLATRSRAEAVRDVIRTVPLDNILLETDSPYLAPARIKEQRNEPANLPIVARLIADLYGQSVDEVAMRTTTAASRAFPALLSATTAIG